MVASSEQTRKPQVAIARSEEEKSEIYKFRYHISVEEMDLNISDADHKSKTLRHPLDESGLHLYMTVDGKVVAAIRLNLGKLTPVPDDLYQAFKLDSFTTYPAEHISFTTQLLVLDKWRMSSVPAVLLGAVYKLIRQQGVRFDFCHCPPYLVALYEQLGYRRYTDNFVDEHTGYTVPMVLLTEDIDYLRKAQSPFFKLAARYASNSNRTALWFEREFPEHATSAPPRRMTDEDFWRMLTQKLHQIPLVSIPLLSGLSYEEAKSFISVGTVLRAKKDDLIVRTGDVGNEMFVLLTGAVEVRLTDSGGTERNLVTLSQGDVFGEVAFLSESPRSANVVAMCDAEVLVLTQAFLKKVMEAMPRITVKVLFNLSLVLCERLKHSNENWMAALGGDDSNTEPVSLDTAGDQQLAG